MAVYTKLQEVDVRKFLQSYDCGELISFEGILQGVENTNYKITTDKDKYILTVFEQRTNKADLPFFFDFMAHLRSHDIYCPFVLGDKSGERIQNVSGKAAALFSFLEGKNVSAPEITELLCFEMGVLLARMHKASESFEQTRTNSMSLSAWKGLANRIEGKVEYSSLINNEIAHAKKTLQLDLPKGVVHADTFPDNIFVRNGRVEGVIDFYFSASDYFVYDLAITVNSWCFEGSEINRERFDRLIEGYQSFRPLAENEKKYFSDFARAAALRILMTRSYDWVFHDPNNLVTPKDPIEYKRILEFHGQNQLLS